jgi:serine/threonine-protein kinase
MNRLLFPTKSRAIGWRRDAPSDSLSEYDDTALLMRPVPVTVGEILAGKYRVESVLGTGGMGAVVAVTHLELGERRAIKLMLPNGLEETESLSRFMREARAASRLKSEHVARVHDVGKLDDGSPYMVMEYLEGSDLRAVVKERGRLPVFEVVDYALQACEALAEAHTMGIVHRDLKPGNLFLTTGPDGTACVKVLDFGVSKVIGASELEMTKTQAVLGSPSYMSPEQMRCARDVDARTDVWALGVICYRLITGELPFRGENITELVTKVLQTSPEPPSKLVPDVPPELDAVLLRCFERELEQRYANVGELAAALMPFAERDARASVDRISRVLSGAGTTGDRRTSRPDVELGEPSTVPVQRPTPREPLKLGTAHEPGSPIPPRVQGSSGDAWVNTPVGKSGVVAVHRWKLWALVAACGTLSVAFAFSLVVSRASPRTADAPVASAPSSVAPPSSIVAPPPSGVEIATAQLPPSEPSSSADDPPAPASAEAPAKPDVAPASVSVKVPPSRAAARTAKPHDPSPPPATVAPEPPPAPPPPAPAAPKAPHRMFGSDN